MTQRPSAECIRLTGVRQNNLKSLNLEIPANYLVVITGVSGSGKSSLAFDTLFAEGQRRYIETFSPYTRQFFERMDKPQADRIEGIPPAIAIERTNTVRTTRSTVGTLTEICDYAKVVWPHLAQLHCRKCGQPVRRQAPHHIWAEVREWAQNQADASDPSAPFLITFSLPLSEKLSLADSLDLIAKQGYRRILVPSVSESGGDNAADIPACSSGVVMEIEAAGRELASRSRNGAIIVVQDCLAAQESRRARFAEACEQAYHFGKGILAIYRSVAPKEAQLLSARFLRRFTNHLRCAQCDLEYTNPTAALFSYNHPVGACPACRGFGRIISIDRHKVIPYPYLTLEEGAIRPWQSGQSVECQQDLVRACRKKGIPMDVPFDRLPQEMQDWIYHGEPGYGSGPGHEWPAAWYGVSGYFRWLESKAYKMHIRVQLSRYRCYTTCPQCQGRRFQPETLLYQVQGPEGMGRMTLADFYAMPIDQALRFVQRLSLAAAKKATDPIRVTLEEMEARLGYLMDVGLGYLSLDRSARSLSGGETERVNLTSCLGSRLVNTLFVMDEPSAGLHAKDVDRLVGLMRRLCDAGNTLVVVEHESKIIRAADQVIDLGPGAGQAGGTVVFQGPYARLIKSSKSLTGLYLGGRRQIEIPSRRPVDTVLSLPESRERPPGSLLLGNVTAHNIHNLSVAIPLNRLVCVTGVSGSGKTTLIRDLLWPCLSQALASRRRSSAEDKNDFKSAEDSDESDDLDHSTASAGEIQGWEALGDAVLVDQSPIGKTPRSNPAVYTGAFDDIRELLADTPLARQRGLKASAFSFNSQQGQCEHCRGAGFEKIEMQFLSDVFIKCPECGGRRYRNHILEIKLSALPGPGEESHSSQDQSVSKTEWSVADILEATVDECLDLLAKFPTRPAQRAAVRLRPLQEVGLGYLRLGQPINTLSGGECQRLKLVRSLAESAAQPNQQTRPTLFLFDEPSVGLHFEDVKLLLAVLQKNIEAGHSVVVIEHNLEIIKCADWVIDLGPGAGEEGGKIVAQGPPEWIAACSASATGQALLDLGLKAAKARAV